MDDIRDQMAISSDISEAISRPALGTELDEDELLEELEQLEQEELDNKLVGVDVPSQKVPTATERRSFFCIEFVLTLRTSTKNQRGRGRGSGITRAPGRDGHLMYTTRIVRKCISEAVVLLLCNVVFSHS
jgi:hypothetical protein